MTETRRGPSGYALVRKQPGRTSFQTVSEIRRTVGSAFQGGCDPRRIKAGHAGTLDRFAEGLLILLFGQYTRLSDLFMASEKRYEALVRFGEETDTLDPEGTVVATGPIPTLDGLESALPRFTGEISQVPPVYSALHVGGERAYEKALRGEEVEMKPRCVTIFGLSLLSWDPPDARILVRCSKGTYIRSLARDLGSALGTRARLQELVRTASGPFSLDDAAIPASITPEAILPLVPGLARALGRVPVALGAAERLAFMGGRSLEAMPSFAALSGDDEYAVFGPDGEMLGLAARERGRLLYRMVMAGPE